MTVNQKYSVCLKEDECKFKHDNLNSHEKEEVLKVFIDSYLEANISMLQSKKTYSFEYNDKSDLLIIGICLEGRMLLIHKEENIIKKGDIFYFRPSQNFDVKYLEHSSLYYLIDLNHFRKLLYIFDFNNKPEDYICKKGELRIERSDYTMKSYIDEIKNIRNTEMNSLLEYVNIKSQLFNYLDCFIKLRLSEESFLEVEKCDLYYVSRVKEIITNNLDQHVSVIEIAQKLDISTYKLQKIFKKIKGTTVYDFIRKTKIDNSKVFLKESSLSIIEIAQKLGYENPSKFSTAFKDIVGITPTEYRQKS